MDETVVPPNASGQNVELLHEGLRQLGYLLPAAEESERHYGVGTEAAVRDLAARRGAWPDVDLAEPVDAAVIEAVRAAADSGRVGGHITLDYGLPAVGIAVLAYNRGFGGEDTLLAQGVTDADGSYSFGYQRGNEPVNLEIRTVDSTGQEVALSAPKMGADVEETLDLVAPAAVAPLAPEYDRLAADLERALRGSTEFGNARERDGRRDLTIAAEATGWDARLLSLAATAAKLAPETGVAADALYALFRVGLPTASEQLFRVSPKVVDKAWRGAAAAGIIKGSRGDLSGARKAFEAHARTALREARAPGASSTFGELIAAVDLPPEEEAAWEDSYLSGASGAALWRTARNRGVSTESVEKLQVQGKLAFLTLNNGQLSAALQSDVSKPEDLAALVDEGLYRPEGWKARVSALADNADQLRELIPPAYAGDRTADRLDAYAADMARKVRLAFPTHVVGHMLEQGDLPLEGEKRVGALLKKAAAEGFELGRTPVAAFFGAKAKALGLDANGKDAALLERVKTVARIFQITPGDDAMKTLLVAGYGSAQDVVEVDHDTFVTRHGDSLGADCELVYRRAEQAVAFSQALVASGRILDSPGVRAISGDDLRNAAARAAATETLVKHYPTMEQLFGSLDFCECEHCRSVLSPAAYLVDLLRFLDPQKAWDEFVRQWNASHVAKFGAGGEYDKPYDQLVARRADIPNLPLTCENTNTVLPYIDVVNEILEYYVANRTYQGHDTGDATSTELLAEPQYVLPQAYATLDAARYPLELPFDLWLETVRAYLAKFGTPLAALLETFRPTDELFRAPNDKSPYFRVQIFAESLGLSPADWTLLTDGAAGSWWQLYGYTTGASAETELASAKTLARRLGVSYRQLTDLVRTSFVNPGLAALGLLAKVGVGLDEVYRFEDHRMSDVEQMVFRKALDDFKKRTRFDAKKWMDERYADGTFDRALVLAAPTIECNFDQTRFQYADGRKAAVLDFVKLNLFVRLWKRLGWTIDELDRALTAFVPENSLPLTETNLGKAMGTAMIYLAHLNALACSLPVDNARTKLPALWSDISTAGQNSPYAQLFLTRTVLKDDPIFDEPTGNYLSDTNPRLVDHRGAVQAALTLSASDLDRIAADAGITLNPPSTPGPTPPAARLSLSNISVLYRYRLLASALDLSIRDLITLKSLSGLDPFAPLDADPLDPAPPAPALPSLLADDHPFTQTLRFVELARVVGASGFTIDELDYLLRHRLDPAGPYRTDLRALLALVVDLGDRITRIKTENAPPDDPAALDDEMLRQKLALVLPADVVETFMGMWRGTIQYDAVMQNVASANAIDATASPFDPVTKPYAVEATVAYDAGRQVQRLTFTGVLLQKRKDEIAPNPGVLRSLLDEVQAQAQTFSRDHLAELFPETALGDFKDVDFTFEPVPSAPAEARTVLGRKRRKIVERLFPLVRQRLTRQLVVESRASTPEVDAALLEALLTDKALLADRGGANVPLLDAFTRAADSGATGTFYSASDGTGSPLSTTDVVEVDTTARPAAAHSARIEGVLVAPATGAYTLFAHIDSAATTVELRLAHLPEPVVATTSANPDYETSVDVDLKAGVAYGMSLDVRWPGPANVTGDVTVLVQGPSLPKGPLSRLELHPASAVESVRRADVLLAKSVRLVSELGLNEREVRHLVTHPADFGSLSLSALPTSELSSAGAAANFAWFARLAEYAALKRDLGLTGDDLVDVFENARRSFDSTTSATAAEAALLKDVRTRVAELLRRDADDVEEVAKALQFSAKADTATRRVEMPDLAQEQGLRRLWDALHTIDTLGASADAVGRWTKIVDPAVTTGRDEIARDLRNSLKAHFADAAWFAVAQPVSDELRRRKRNALVAYIVADPQHDFEHPDELYEFFLIDPATEPVVQTSRLQVAISAVQLFVQRCLLNLEPRVPAAAIGMGDAKPWEWMKRYRVWEANRKIFLYPENWLEPEFRDAKTHLFAELEGSLLEGEISNESAEDAFVAYLSGLETIARLQVVSMYAEERLSDQSRTLHVFGRTFAAPRKYYYRRHAYGVWSPWEPVDIEIEGDHVAAVVWRDRLHLFWLTFEEKGETRDATATATTTDDLSEKELIRRTVEIRLNWSEQVRGEWTGRSATTTSTVIERDVGAVFDSSSFFVWVSKEKTNDGTEGALFVHVVGGEHTWPGYSSRFRIAGKHSAPTVEALDYGHADAWPPPDWYSALGYDATRYTAGGLGLFYGLATGRHILDAAPFGNFELLLADNRLTQPPPPPDPAIFCPFFFEDEQHTFFVEPVTRETSFLVRDDWVLAPDGQGRFEEVDLIDSIDLESAVPDLHVEPRPPEPYAVYTVTKTSDWVTHPDNVIAFDGVLIGREGAVRQGDLDVTVAPLGAAAGNGHFVTPELG